AADGRLRADDAADYRDLLLRAADVHPGNYADGHQGVGSVGRRRSSSSSSSSSKGYRSADGLGSVGCRVRGRRRGRGRFAEPLGTEGRTAFRPPIKSGRPARRLRRAPRSERRSHLHRSFARRHHEDFAVNLSSRILSLAGWLLPAFAVAAAPGASPAPSGPARPDPVPRLVFASYLYGYQGDARRMNPADGRPSLVRLASGASALTHHPWESDGPWFSGDRPQWHMSQLQLMQGAGIDVALPLFEGD